MHTYLPERQERVYSRRSRKHSKSLIDKTTHFNDRHFLIRALYTKLLLTLIVYFYAYAVFLHLP